MDNFVPQLLAWVAANEVWAGVVVFLVSAAESMAVVGVLVPGVAMMFGAGALIAAGALEFWPTVAWAVGGAVVGDGLSFWLGYHFRDRLTGVWPFSKHPDMLRQGIDFFRRYGGKSVAIGRFFGPVRAVIPLIAGMMNMPPLRFYVANFISALAWAPAYLLPGIVFGASLQLASEVAFRLVILLLGLGLLGWLAIWLVRQSFRLLQPRASNLLSRMLIWSRLHPKLGEIGVALGDPGHPEAKGLALFASLLFLSALVFAFVITKVLDHTGLGGLDLAVFHGLQSLHTPWADSLMLGFSRLGDGAVILPFLLVAMVFCAVQRHWRSLWYWIAAAGFALAVPIMLKYGLRIPRPPGPITQFEPYSFPSGHTMRATVFFGFLAVVVARALPPLRRWMPYSLTVLAVLGVGLARLYIGAHWLSDVLASLTLGLVWVAALGIAYHRHTDRESHWFGLAATLSLTLALAFGVSTWRHHQQEMSVLAPQKAVVEMTEADWWEQAWRQLPGTRLDTRHRLNHPLNLQYLGTPEELTTALSGQGWRPAERLAWGNLLKLLSPSLPLDQLPVLPQVHDGRHEVLSLDKALGDGPRLVLRLWPADVRLQPGNHPLWLGNVSIQRQERVLELLNFPRTDETAYDRAWQTLLGDLGAVTYKQPAGERNLLLLRLPLVVPAASITPPAPPPNAATTHGVPRDGRAHAPRRNPPAPPPAQGGNKNRDSRAE